MKLNEFFSGSYLKAADLKGKKVPVEIDKVVVETIEQDGEQKEKLVVYFAGKKQGLVLNKTNAGTIAEVVGSDDTDHWTSIKIKLYPTTTEFAGKEVECIRVEKPLPPEATEDEVPF